jgi:hypothetical protein
MSAHPYTWMTVALYMAAAATGGAMMCWVIGWSLPFGVVFGCIVGFHDGYELLLNQPPRGAR